MIKVFCIIPPDDEGDFWATDVLDLEEKIRSELARKTLKIEQYPWGITNYVESNAARYEVLLRNELISL